MSLKITAGFKYGGYLLLPFRWSERFFNNLFKEDVMEEEILIEDFDVEEIEEGEGLGDGGGGIGVTP